jgi:hypothetical protein
LTIIKRRQRQTTTFFLPNLEKEEAGAATGTFKYILRQWNDAYTAWIDPFTYDSSTGNVIFWVRYGSIHGWQRRNWHDDSRSEIVDQFRISRFL